MVNGGVDSSGEGEAALSRREEKFCVIVPGYNEEKSIGGVVRGVLKHCPDVVVVDDGSTDGTVAEAEGAGARVVKHEANRGKGIALGVNEDALFQNNEKTGLDSGQIIFLSTDGIWEARNPEKEMFGKNRVCEILRRHASSGAEAIVEAIINELHRFTRGVKIEDDVTLVVIKLG